MGVVRWVRVLMPVVVTGLLAGMAGTGTSLASDPPWQPPPCPVAVPSAASAGSAGWYRLTPVLDATGTLVAQQLTVAARGGVIRAMNLPPESFASGPSGGLLVVGDDDGTRSRLRVLDLAHGCARLDVEETSVIRSALTASDGASLWEHRVDRGTRADMGIWRRAMDDGSSARLLPGISDNPDYGPTFVTELRESSDGHLVVASCGATACRTRVVDTETSRVALVEQTGPPIGFTGGWLVTHAPCDWWPCAVVAVDPESGARQTLVDDANHAELGGAVDGLLVYQEPDGALAIMDVDSRSRAVLGAGGRLGPVRRGSMAETGVDLPMGSVLVAPDGRMDDVREAWRLDPATQALTTAEEVTP